MDRATAEAFEAQLEHNDELNALAESTTRLLRAMLDSIVALTDRVEELEDAVFESDEDEAP